MVDGLLWFDTRIGNSLEDELEKAAQAYYERFGVRPNICYMHPSTLFEGLHTTPPVTVNDILLFETNSVLPGHYWLSFDQTKQPSAA